MKTRPALIENIESIESQLDAPHDEAEICSYGPTGAERQERRNKRKKVVKTKVHHANYRMNTVSPVEYDHDDDLGLVQ